MSDNERNEFDDLLRDVARLPREIEPPQDLWPEIAARLATRRDRTARHVVWVGLAAAAGVATFLLGRALEPRWRVTALAGRPSVEGGSVSTDRVSRAHIALSIGDVDLEPETRLRVLAVRRNEQRFALERGAIAARVTAPPRVFVVETPSAVATDLGCAYTLAVDSAGNGLLRVTSGIVEFAGAGRMALVPLGAAVQTHAGRGPGVPYVDDASPALRRALERVDASPEDSTALAQALAAARRDDALSLWHLLSRVDAPLRGAVFERLAQLVPPPPGITRSGILELDRPMLDAWWKYLPRTVWRIGL